MRRCTAVHDISLSTMQYECTIIQSTLWSALQRRTRSRLLITVLLLTAVAMGAPQEPGKNEEPYVKVQPVNATTFQNLTPESSVEPLVDFNRRVRSDDVTTEDQSEATTEVAEPITDLDRSDQAADSAEVKTRSKTPRPRFYSKLSYFQKPNYVGGPSLANLLERANKRKFKSRCRCEKIWNCPKLQITVPRCPDEYFMCCF